VKGRGMRKRDEIVIYYRFIPPEVKNSRFLLWGWFICSKNG